MWLVSWRGHGAFLESRIFYAAQILIHYHQTVSSLGTFFYAMAICPEVQAKAKKELDHFIGSGRLVNFGDRASLPYIEAVHQEIIRWKPAVPMGVAHAASSDDVYKGYYIPKGS